MSKSSNIDRNYHTLSKVPQSMSWSKEGWLPLLQNTDWKIFVIFSSFNEKTNKVKHASSSHLSISVNRT